MKVIVAGLPKTGTKSMNAALTTLGYKVYDYLEHFWYHNEDWKEIFEGDGNVETFRKMYKDVDAVVDVPAFAFWEQIHEAFPEAKIIQMSRDEDSWWKSFQRQVDEWNEWNLFKIARIITPTGRKFTSHFNRCLMFTFGLSLYPAWADIKPVEQIYKLKFRQYSCYVTTKAPKDKLLIYKIQDGWEPLCKFLGAEIPDIPFPHKNVRGSAIKEAAEENAIMRKMIEEIKIITIVFSVLVALFCIAFAFL